MTFPLPRRMALCCATVLTVLTSLAHAGEGEFYQFDAGPAGTSLVAVKDWGGLKLSANHARWNREGHATGAALMKSLPLPADSTLQVAVGLQALDHRSAPEAASPSDSGLGAKISAEWQPRLQAAQAYVLLERASVFGAWLAVAQYKPDSLPVGIEWAAAGDKRWYVGRSVALRYGIPGTRWSVRVGHRFSDDRVFVGVNYNSF